MRTSGILYHITSLPSPYGIGTCGRHAREFADFLVKAGQSCWQILPLCPTSYGDSPYQSFSTFAGNTNIIDLEQLIDDGLLEKRECDEIFWGSDPLRVDYDAVSAGREKLFALAYKRFASLPREGFEKFCSDNAEWLEDFALFMALKEAAGGVSWDKWDKDIRLRRPQALAAAREKYAVRIDYYKFLQYIFSGQWNALKKYCNDRGIKIIGDLPIYVAADSADVWASPELFMLDSECLPVEVAGCPPDAFTADGQLWGNPIYNWDKMAAGGYGWWIRRMKRCTELYDITRIDHFRGFEAYYSIPYGMPNARVGEWKKGPGLALFRAMEQSLGKLDIIAEDLGFLTASVRRMLKESGYPGMKVLQFAFWHKGNSLYLPHNYERNCVVYTGTHDNDTIIGWEKSTDPRDVRYAREYTQAKHREPLNWPMMRTALASSADTAVLTMQDLLGLGSAARMNIPSTVGGNWSWRAPDGVLTGALASRLYRLCDIYRRLPGSPRPDDSDEIEEPEETIPDEPEIPDGQERQAESADNK